MSGFIGIGSFEKRIGVNKSESDLKKERKTRRESNMEEHRKAFDKTTRKVEKPFKNISQGLDFGKPKKVKKSYSSGGMRF